MTLEGLARWAVALLLVFLFIGGIPQLDMLPEMPTMEGASPPSVAEWQAWQQFQGGTMADLAARAIAGTLLVLAVIFVLRGRIRLDNGKAGVMVKRFGFMERFIYWLVAISLLLVVTSWLVIVCEQSLLAPAFERLNGMLFSGANEAGYSEWVLLNVGLAARWLHDTVLWAFALGLVLAVLVWGLRCIPTLTDITWLLKGGGILPTRRTPSARKFNGGQKLSFWLFVLFGLVMVTTGAVMVLPDTLPMLDTLRTALLATGEAIGFVPAAASDLTAFQQSQYIETAHTIAVIALAVLALLHIYFNTLGKEGAFSALYSGKVDVNWARQHHDLWGTRIEMNDRKPAPADRSRPQGVSKAYTGPMPMRAPTKPS